MAIPPTLFIIWVLEGSGCGSTCPGNDVKLYLMVRFQFWRFGECGAPLHHHCSLVHTGPEWLYLLWSHLWVKQKNVFIKKLYYPLRIDLFQNFIGIKWPTEVDMPSTKPNQEKNNSCKDRFYSYLFNMHSYNLENIQLLVNPITTE